MSRFSTGREDRGTTITAQFDSRCPECGEDIFEGDTIVMLNGGAVCESCGDE